MRPIALLLLFCVGCAAPHPPTADLDRTRAGVQTFLRSVSEGVTRQGPAAWQTYFENKPAFFMAVDGHVEFQDGAAAQAAIPGIARAIKSIQLDWGAPVRIDVLSPDLAAVAAPWREITMLADGKRSDESGFFTALVEKHESRWQFRNAHWSTAAPPGPAK